jgi:S-adenosylmethionine synthetase
MRGKKLNRYWRILKMRLFSTEQISKYHPDKFADQISDAILTECLRQDPTSHCGIETMVKDSTVVLGGEITTSAVVDFESLVNKVANKLAYNVDKVINLIGQQSPQINGAVKAAENIGAGDQGIMFGYATSETDSYLPFGFDLANKIIKAIEGDIETNSASIFKGDAKCQVTVDLDNPGYVEEILISACHKEGYTLDEVREYILNLVGPIANPNKWTINPAGIWTLGGAHADCGLTGRKIVCDQYGGYCAVGGGAFSGKDPTKVDRSATYMARKIAVDLVKTYDLKWCEVQLAYAIGVAKPVSVNIKNDKNLDLAEVVKNTYNLTPKGIIEHLGLLSVDYEKFAEGCHFYNTSL